jgi:molecular chaperone GrpE (heat shock protein)
MSEVYMTEEEAKLLRGSKALMDQLLKNPKTRRTAEGLVKTLYPETTTTDDLAEPYVKRMDGLEKKLDEFFKRTDGEKLDNKLNAQLNELRTTRSYTEDGIEKIKKVMVEKSIPDAIAAADHWERQNPPTPNVESNFAPTDWGFGRKTDDKDLTLLFTDEDQWAEKEARKVWQEEATKKSQIIT